MTDQYDMPEATRSAMAASTDLLFESDRRDPPTADVEGLVRPIEELIKKDPEANQAFRDLTAKLESIRDDDVIDVDTLRNHPVRLLYSEGAAAAAAFQIREAPFDYADKDGGNALMTPNAAAANLGIIGKAGSLVSGSMGDIVGGTCWTGNAVTNESVGSQPNHRVRISPFIKWAFFWDLIVAGIADGFVGSDPWASCRVGVKVSAWDEFGNNVALEGPRELFYGYHSDDPGTTPNKISGAESGFVNDLKVFFTIPPGKTRWVNVDAYFELKTRYSSIFNLAGAIGSYNVEVLSYIMRPAEPGE
jgi:hypothetical protein